MSIPRAANLPLRAGADYSPTNWPAPQMGRRRAGTLGLTASPLIPGFSLVGFVLMLAAIAVIIGVAHGCRTAAILGVILEVLPLHVCHAAGVARFDDTQMIFRRHG